MIYVIVEPNIRLRGQIFSNEINLPGSFLSFGVAQCWDVRIHPVMSWGEQPLLKNNIINLKVSVSPIGFSKRGVECRVARRILDKTRHHSKVWVDVFFYQLTLLLWDHRCSNWICLWLIFDPFWEVTGSSKNLCYENVLWKLRVVKRFLFK